MLRQAALGVAMLSTSGMAFNIFNPLQGAFSGHMKADQAGITRLDIDSANRTFIDQDQRQVMLHGVNVVYKVDPYIPSDEGFDGEDSLNDEDIANLKKWGFNLVRLGVMWEAVEREPGVYDETYLDKVETLINKLGDAGIYTLVDAHQDVFARRICGEGVPDFYAADAIGDDPKCFGAVLDPFASWMLSFFGLCTDFDSFGFRTDENGDPLIEDCQSRDFYTYYETKQAMEAFHSLLVTNKNGLQDKFVAYWDRVTERFAGNNYVVGYDPLNEPFPGNPTRDLMNLYPGHFDRNYLAPLYAKIFENANKHDSTKQLWFEPVPFPDILPIFGGEVSSVGFKTPPGADIGSPLHALNDHTYCCQADSAECVSGEPKIEDADMCLTFHHRRLDTRADDAKRLGVPFIITEFGACLTEGPCTQEITQVAQVADENLAGWAYWQFKTFEDLTTSAGTGSEGFYNSDGSLQEYKVKALGRPYMMYTQGTLTNMKYDDAANSFHAEFTLGNTTAQNVAFLSQDYYFTCGIQANVTVAGAAVPIETLAYDYTNGFLNFTIDSSYPAGSAVTLDVVEAACN